MTAVNRVADPGATAISKMLMTNVTLTMLNLKGNLIASSGQKAIAQAMAHNAIIQSLVIDGAQPPACDPL